MELRRLGRATLAAALAAAISAPGIAEGVEYSPALTLSEPVGSILHEPSVAIDPAGGAIVVWTRYVAEGDVRVESARIDPDGAVGAVRTLTQSASAAWSPRVAVDADGRATVVWYGGAGTHTIQAVRVNAAGDPGPVMSLSPFDSREAQLVVDSRGRATVVWHRGGGSSLAVQSVRIDEHGSPGTVRTLSVPGEGGFLPRLAVDSHDRITVAWSGDEHVQAVRIGSDGAAGPVLSLSEGSYGHGLPTVAVDSANRATVVWQQDTSAAEREHPDDGRRIKAVRIDAGGVPGPVQTVSEAGQALGPSVAIDRRDRAVIAWADQLSDVVKSVRLTPDGARSAELDLDASPPGRVNSPAVAADECGAVVTWSESDGLLAAGGRVKASRIGFDGGPDGPTNVSGEGSWNHTTPSVATDSSNRATLVWVRSNGAASSSVQLARSAGATCPAETSSPPPPPPPPPPAGPSRGKGHGRLVVPRRAAVRRARIVLFATCGRGSACAGTLRLVRRGVVLARIRYDMPAGSRRKLVAKLSRRGRRLLASSAGPVLNVRARYLVGMSARARTTPVQLRLGPRRRPRP